MIGIVITVDASGPVFDGRAQAIIAEYARRVEDRLGSDGVQRIRQYLPTQYMYLGHNGGDPIHNPVPSDAGYLVAHILAHRDTPESVLITDGGYPGMIYGPWIEGIAPGNTYFGMAGRAARGLPPRFPGYHAFRKTTHELNMVATEIAEAMLPPYLGLINE
jgi:hypothetical protein